MQQLTRACRTSQPWESTVLTQFNIVLPQWNLQDENLQLALQEPAWSSCRWLRERAAEIPEKRLGHQREFCFLCQLLRLPNRCCRPASTRKSVKFWHKRCCYECCSQSPDDSLFGRVRLACLSGIAIGLPHLQRCYRVPLWWG